jgi:hypothetical protein
MFAKVIFQIDSICPSSCVMMQIKNPKLPMKKNKTAKARLGGASPVCFDGWFTGYTEKTWPRGAAGHLSTE